MDSSYSTQLHSNSLEVKAKKILFVMKSLRSLFLTFVLFCSCLSEWGRKDIKELHIVLSNHLDVGYSYLIVDVINKYFDEYFPKIHELSLAAKELKLPFIYTTQSWLISLYLECPPNACFFFFFFAFLQTKHKNKNKKQK